MIQEYKPLYTVAETAKILRINKQTIYKILREGELPYVILGSKKIKGIDLENYINNYPVSLPEEIKEEEGQDGEAEQL